MPTLRGSIVFPELRLLSFAVVVSLSSLLLASVARAAPPIVFDPNPPPIPDRSAGEVRTLEVDLAPLHLEELEGAAGELTRVVASAPKLKITVLFQNGKPAPSTPTSACSVFDWSERTQLSDTMVQRLRKGTALIAKRTDGGVSLVSGFAVVIRPPQVCVDVQFLRNGTGNFRRYVLGEYDADGIFRRTPEVQGNVNALPPAEKKRR